MTEEEWLDEANCVRLLEFLEERFDDELSLDGKDLDGSYNAIQRKLALFGCACCRLHWNRITKNDLRQSIEATEQLAEGLLEVEEWRQAIKSDDEEGDTEWEATVRGVGLSTGMTYVSAAFCGGASIAGWAGAQRGRWIAASGSVLD
jgi:hypothetical protein